MTINEVIEQLGARERLAYAQREFATRALGLMERMSDLGNYTAAGTTLPNMVIEARRKLEAEIAFYYTNLMVHDLTGPVPKDSA